MVLGRTSTSQSLSTFFGLTPKEAAEYRAGLFSQIHEIVFHGKGGYDFGTVYNMPIWLRRLTFRRIAEFYEEQNKESGNSKPTNDIPKGPNISPSYSTKASK
jgi:tRNA(His) 5'-end guanylyltransferase